MTLVDNFRRPLKCDFHACKQTREKFGDEARFRFMPQLNFTDYGIHGKFCNLGRVWSGAGNKPSQSLKSNNHGESFHLGSFSG